MKWCGLSRLDVMYDEVCSPNVGRAHCKDVGELPHDFLHFLLIICGDLLNAPLVEFR